MAAPDEGQEIDFCTLGMFIIDDIDFTPPTSPVKDILGGAGSYSALGARIFSPSPQSKSIGWIVHAGSDFPSELRDIIARWDTSCEIRETPDRLTTRGWNGYGANEARAFEYKTDKMRLDHDTLTPTLLRSKSFHLICSPERCIDLVQGITSRRSSHSKDRPVFLWEPVPDLCVPEQLENCYKALEHIDIISPNHAELCGFFSESPHIEGSDKADRDAIDRCCRKLINAAYERMQILKIVVRAGKDGCCVYLGNQSQWLPAYHADPEKVVDPTGGGNAFLGGLATAFVRSSNPDEWARLVDGAAWGSVAASFAIEQVGMPVCGRNSNSEETWNGEVVQHRLQIFRKRLDTTPAA